MSNPKTVGYVRVSTDEQAKDGVSIQNQVEKIKAYCIAMDLDLVELIIEEGTSAKNLKRQGVTKLISLCKRKKADAVVIYKLDRLTRSLKDLNYLIYDVFLKNEIAFKSICDTIDTSTANGRMVINILGTVAQWERETISERTKEALAYKKRKGERVGEVPYGYDPGDNGKLAANPTEQKGIERMRELRGTGMSLASIATTMGMEGFTPKKSLLWNPYSVSKILKRKDKPQDIVVNA